MLATKDRMRFASLLAQRMFSIVPLKREPNTTSALPSMIGVIRSMYSLGSSSRSASSIITIVPVASGSPVRMAAPFPLLPSWWTMRMLGRVPSMESSMARVPSFDPSFTTINSISTSPMSTDSEQSIASATVVSSLYTGMMTLSFSMATTSGTTSISSSYSSSSSRFSTISPMDKASSASRTGQKGVFRIVPYYARPGGRATGPPPV